MMKKILISGMVIAGLSSVAYSDVKIGNPWLEPVLYQNW